MRKKNGRVRERFNRAVLKTVRAQVHVGSNPTPSSFNKLCLALGMSRGLISRYRFIISGDAGSKTTLDEIDRIIEEVCYGRRPRKRAK